MNTAAGPWPVQVLVRSVPHLVSTVPGTTVPSALLARAVRQCGEGPAARARASVRRPAAAR
jgi:hypothetical protein